MRTILFTIVFLTFGSNALAQNRCKIRVNGKYGFIDTLGQVKIPPIYTYAGQFSEYKSVVWVNGKAGYIDTSGQMTIPPQYEFASHFSHGMAVVGINKQYGIIDTSGNSIVPLSYEWLTTALMNEHRIGFRADGLWGYLNRKGEIIVPAKFEYISRFHNGTARVKFNGLYGVIDTMGRYIVPPKFSMIRGDRFYDGRIAVKQPKSSKFYFIDLSGNQITAPLFYEPSVFSEGLAFVRENYDDLGYYIDTSGRRQFSEQFEYGGSFKKGYAVVKKAGKYGVINKQGIFIVPPVLDGAGIYYQRGYLIYWKYKRKGIRYGLIGLNGRVLTKPIYTSIVINDGDCPFPELYKNGKDSYDYNTQLGYVNWRGKYIWRPKK